jgi:hypothetical protein
VSKLNGVVVAEQVVADLDPLAVLRDTRQRLAEELEAKLVMISEMDAELVNLRRQRDVLRESLRRLDVALAGPKPRRRKAVAP